MNGGKKVSPLISDAIYDNDGIFLFKGDSRSCVDCNLSLEKGLTKNIS